MTRYSDWFTPDPVIAAPQWYWWDRANFDSSTDVLSTGPTTRWPQELGATSPFFGVGASAQAVQPDYARSLYAWNANDFIPRANVTDVVGTDVQPSVGASGQWRIAELHISTDGTRVTWPDPPAPDGATVEWEYSAWNPTDAWQGPWTAQVGWGLRAGVDGVVGSAAAQLCRVPGVTLVDDAARSDPSLWTPIASLTDTAATAAASVTPNPVQGITTPGAGVSAVTSISDTIPVLNLAIRLPELLTSPTVAGYPITIPTISGWTTGPSSWSVYAAAAQISTINVTRMFQPPRYRFVYPSHGQWPLRQRQTLPTTDSWPLRQRQNGAATGSWPLRQRQRGA